MIPYFRAPSIPLGSVMVSPFLIAILTGAAVMHYRFLGRLRARGLSADLGARMSLIVSVSTLLFAHLMVAVYEPARFLSGRMRLWDLWSGLSAMGGTIGFLSGWMLFRLLHRSHPSAGAPMFDAAVYCAPLGCAVMRIGCFIVHDHPGKPSQHWLAVAFPDGARWDLGLIEMLFWFAMAGAFVLLDRKPRAAGFYPALTFVIYPLFRLSVLPLRLGQTQYSGLPVDAWVAMIVVPIGLWFAQRTLRRAAEPAR